MTGSAGSGARTGTTADPDAAADLREQLSATLRYARERDYVGWDLYDGESSLLLRALPVDDRWVNLAFQQLPRRAPVNLRPLLLVERRRSFLGASLFALANYAAADLTGVDGYAREARDLVDWLVATGRDGYAGFCGGHNHHVQELDKRVPPETPDVVSTSYAVKALLEAGTREDPAYRERALTAADFLREDLDPEPAPDGRGTRIRYKANDVGDVYTPNANALGARLLVDLHDATGDPSLRDEARAILDYVAARQTDRGGWFYADPPDASHLSMDSFHNGFVIESFARYRAVTGDDRYDDVLRNAVGFYRSLFEVDGAPRADESSAYPRDVHASAQGAIVRSMRGDLRRAAAILRWAVDSLSDGDGRFYHQRRRPFVVRITLMRWCQAWMAYALARHLLARSERGGLVA